MVNWFFIKYTQFVAFRAFISRLFCLGQHFHCSGKKKRRMVDWEAEEIWDSESSGASTWSRNPHRRRAVLPKTNRWKEEELCSGRAARCVWRCGSQHASPLEEAWNSKSSLQALQTWPDPWICPRTGAAQQRYRDRRKGQQHHHILPGEELCATWYNVTSWYTF